MTENKMDLTIFLMCPTQDTDVKTDEEVHKGNKLVGQALKETIESAEDNIFDVRISYPDPKWRQEEPLVYLGKTLELMGRADVVYFPDNWTSSKMCMIAREATTMFDFPVLELIFDEKKGE